MRRRKDLEKLSVKTVNDAIRRIIDGKPVYTQERYNRFVDEAMNAGHTIIYHEGFLHKGPAIKCATKKEISILLKTINLPCRWEQLDKGYVVFPL